MELIRRFLRLENRLVVWLSFVAPTVTRIVVGWAMHVDGAAKVANLDKVASFFASLYIPFTSIPLPHPHEQAAAIAYLEDYGGMLLILGVLVRPVSLALVGAMVGAVLMSDTQEFLTKWAAASPTDSSSFTYFVLLLWPMFYGGGPLSVDGAIAALFKDWVEDAASWQSRLGEIVTCWTIRGLVVLVLLALLPVDGASDQSNRNQGWLGNSLVILGIKSQVVRDPHPGEFDEDPPKHVVEYAPNLKMLAVYAGAWVALGLLLYFTMRAKPLPITGSKKKVVIVGAGFGGLYTALELDQTIAQDPWVEVTLINRENFHLFTPMLHEVASCDVEVTHIVNPIRKMLKHVNFFEGTVDKVDLAARKIHVSHGLGECRVEEIDYDQIVFALGAVTNFFKLPGVQEHALTMKSLGDAIQLRNRVIEHLEQAACESTPAGQEKLLTFVVAGGGFAGVETTAAINDFVREALSYYPNLHEEQIRTVVVHPGDYLLPELGEQLGRYTGKKLAERKVEIKFNTRVLSFQNGVVCLSDGSEIKSRLLVWTAGTSPNPLISSLPCKLEKGRLVVDATMEVPDHPGVWGLGDCVYMVDPDTKTPYPPTAQHALRQGKVLANNIERTLRGEPRKPFVFKTLGMLAAIGRRTGVAQIMGFNFSGFVAWWMWRTIYLMKLPRVEKQLRVVLDWTLDLVFTKDLVQFQTFRSHGMSQAEGHVDGPVQEVAVASAGTPTP